MRRSTCCPCSRSVRTRAALRAAPACGGCMVRSVPRRKKKVLVKTFHNAATQLLNLIGVVVCVSSVVMIVCAVAHTAVAAPSLPRAIRDYPLHRFACDRPAAREAAHSVARSRRTAKVRVGGLGCLFACCVCGWARLGT
jgi:hypothetical protein